MLLIGILISLLVSLDAASLNNKREKRGLLSRSGVCPNPIINFVVKDTRLNFYGFQYFLPGDDHPPCYLSECQYDVDCRGDRKCCTNHCGANVCTEAERDPHPCENFQCPITKVCKVQRVRCIEPVCPDLQAISRPICVSGGPYYQIGKRSRIPRPLIKALKENKALRSQDVVMNPERPFYDRSLVFYGDINK